MVIARLATRIGRAAATMTKMAPVKKLGFSSGLRRNRSPQLYSFARAFTHDCVFSCHPAPRSVCIVDAGPLPALQNAVMIDGDLIAEVQMYCGALDDNKVLEAAKYAIEEYNRREDKNLRFLRLATAAIRDFGGFMYYFRLVALDGDDVQTFLEKVYQNYAKKHRFELHLFRPIPGSETDLPITVNGPFFVDEQSYAGSLV